MLRAIQQFFDTHISSATDRSERERAEHGYQLATAALLFEVSRADYDVKGAERDTVKAAVQRAFGLTCGETAELVRLAELEAEQSISLHEFTTLINGHFSRAEKQHIVELLWQVAYADGDIDKYEEHLIRKVADLIHLPHRAFIQAKHRAQQGPKPR
ncbi:MAG: TerB family tellurite resistance protein [Gammaproteobacteria bacterium]|nr:TerB family tellurite resistance protein [Gammaproteobacteria bacterium]NIR84087.1 TerB family tellurite resistance protein [Gammaproteobacteria bacterium]NIR89231.1 TerB family tellurite resistance protein [Gammaproteobacteria bacterium]NIU05033.1 TerB family tellurite resistance protein [Gammaproteobacteria bacterium]NIV52199.1 TerB family tellurite resistance protein [Gammaproteobacteria bacterium]